VEKYRPNSLDDVEGHQDILATINRFVETNRLPHLLLYGPPGTGKTSTVLALARRIYGAKNMRQMVLELNASDDRGIEVVRFVKISLTCFALQSPECILTAY
jgi:replication factor C subunit 3/5